MLNKKTKWSYFISVIILIILMLTICLIINIFVLKFINNYNNEIMSMGLVSEFDYKGQYKHLFVKDKIYTENPIIFNNKEYLAVTYQKILYQKHIKDDYEKRWNGRYWYEEKVKKEYYSWDLVKQETQDVDKIYFNVFSFDKNILGKMNFKLISENINNGKKECYYGVENNQEVVIYFKNYNNLSQDNLWIYNNYEEALEDICLPKICFIVCLNIILILIGALILYLFIQYYKEKVLLELNEIESDNL